MTRRHRYPVRVRWISTAVIGILVIALVAASAVSVVAVPRQVSVLPAASVDSIDDADVPDAVLASRTLFDSAPVAVVVAQSADSSTTADAADLAIDNRVPMFRIAPDTAEAVSTELRRLGVARAVRVGDDVGDLGVAVTDDPSALAGEAAAGKGTGAIVLVSAAGPDAIATAKASGAATVAMPAPDPRVSGEAIRLLKERPDAPVRVFGAGFGDRAQVMRRIELARTVPELPGGGQVMFPGRRVIALYGSPGAPELGPVGRQSIPASIARVKKLAARYDRLSPVPVVPGFEIIVSVASAAPGPSGDYSSVLDVDAVRPWVDAARKAGVYVTLDLQPGRMDFLTQAKMFRDLLRQPHVGLALDPEWRLKPNQVHLTQIGSVAPAEVNRTSSWLADLVAKHRLPQKAFVLHQFDADMLGDRSKIDTRRDELAFVIHADGHGIPSVKMFTWNRIVEGLPSRTWLGWKNFFTEDKPMFSPKRTMRVAPTPWFISYQ
ncbi:hypothetical protein [Gordonia hydrophobica]|uniref:Uncharacterized protein n=1 Tax=Gordonia hydrophobica TaxID=40516 RepID=A0ABZ2U4H6_9ACTN|nr:hypothetical protein [Gordonia hydrophobica]MBM7368371.1 hypothetical protein [Gordonia hydrophobica]